ncbi:hypothetical protein SERLA73DRAFT_61388 [Serpula lacrymans var. lacrymans S7.3]|uniref:RING-type E3 ubiquitin transferase n=1 Tax=Serpula lacrymans var. lacrymans (strain S7.3) TaxID=936435 RepID=F8Q937_SERL3|nr:hypothetical protein SERLA73DRAFT_61388 [Serpula lacrymans var. lacrymans S7.3]
MQEAEEQGTHVHFPASTLRKHSNAWLDTCRICSAPGESDQPLFYPCKCSGTIRYIHQDCLTTWLAHSKKKTCDVCKHPYSFTKVYASDMPATLPPLLFMRRLAQQLLFALLFGVRTVLIGVMWLAVLPWITIWTWRVYFTVGESVAWWISGSPRPSSDPQYDTGIYDNNNTHTNDTITTFEYQPLFVQMMTRPFWRTLSNDIFAGQIIASLIVLVFVAVFLLREWISQNARPGVFEDDEVVPEVREQPPQAPLQRAPIVEPRQVPVNLPDPPPALQNDPLVIRGIDHAHIADLRRNQARLLRARRNNPFPFRPPGWRPEGTDVEDEDRVAAVDEMRRHRRVMEHDVVDVQEGFRDTTNVWRRKGKARAQEDDDELPPGVRMPARARRRLLTDPDLQSNVSTSSDSEDHLSTHHHHRDIESTYQGEVSRPAVLAANPSSNAPLVSPGLVSYRAPEDLEPGPSSSSTNYFEQRKRPQEDLEEYDRYFQEVQADNDGIEKRDDAEQRPTQESEEEEEEEEYEEGEAEEAEEDETDEDSDWEVEVELEQQGVGEIRDALNINALNINQPQQPIALEQFAEALDEMDGNVEDDMEGALEAIGLRGPIFGVIQNATLMIFVLDTAIGFGVGLPFLFGKSTALLSLNPQRSLHILHLPIRAMRFITDPIVDLVTLFLGRIVFPYIVHTFQALFSFSHYIFWALTEQVLGEKAAAWEADLTSMTSRYLEAASHLLDKAAAQWPSTPSGASATRGIEKILESDWQVIRLAEPHFATLGFQVRNAIERLQETWIRLALGHGTKERIFAVVLGYGVVALVLALYLNVLTVGNARTAGRAVRGAIRQQLLVVKASTFIVIELVVFPLGCGTMLDACTVWVFPEASLESRAAFFSQAPLTAMFYHWVAGTMFMYQFAILLAGCRTIMRPGAMWFIKDPQDQNFHPIRDILDRPTLTQLRKLLVSAVMYSVVVACGVGSIATLLFIGNKSIFPLRWKTREPLSDVPVDLLFLLLALPYTLHYFRPRKVLHRAAVLVWKFLAAELRLTSYMFGERHPSEEVTVKYKTWSGFFVRTGTDEDDVVNVSDGTFRRVPAKDNIALPRDMRATAQVHEDGEPVDDGARQLIATLDAEAEKAKRDIKTDFTIVYIPPNFRSRIIYFILAIWVIVAVLVSAGVALPIQVGRQFFKLFVAKDIHDGYSFIAGFYLLWGCYVVAKTTDRMDKRRQRRSGGGPRARFSVFFVKRSFLWFAKISYMILFLGIIIPVLLALVVELYITIPIRLTLNPAMVPHLRIVDLWALGLVYGTIGLRVRRVQPPNQITRGLATITHKGWTRPDPLTATKEVIGPLTGGFLGMVLLPAAMVWAARHFLALPIDNKFTLLHVYPGIFAVAGLARSLVVSVRLLSSWSQSIRDKEFLVEMRLRNLEPEVQKPHRDEPVVVESSKQNGTHVQHL